MTDLGCIQDPSCCDDRDGDPVFFSIAFCACDDLPDLLVIIRVKAVLIQMGQHLIGKAQMSAGMSAFDYKEISCAVIMAVPHLQNNAGSLFRGYDGGDFGIGSLYICGQIYRETGAGNDNICAGFGCCACIVAIISRGDHDIVTEKSVTGAVHPSGYFFCFLKFKDHGTQVCFF